MHRQKYKKDILIGPCPDSPSLNTETRVILLKTHASIKIFQGRKKGGGIRIKTPRQNVYGY